MPAARKVAASGSYPSEQAVAGRVVSERISATSDNYPVRNRRLTAEPGISHTAQKRVGFPILGTTCLVMATATI